VFERYRYAYLLVTLGILIIGRPFLPDFGRNFVIGMLGLSLITAAVTSADSRYQVWIGSLMTCAIVFSALAPDGFAGLDMTVLSPALGIVYWALTGILIIRRIVLKTERITADTINGAICVYLLLGLGWSHAYALLDAIEPGSFTTSAESVATAGHAFEGFIGYSFVTLTTLGYGNVVPLTPRGESLAIAEAITGQLYVAVLLARFVAMEIATRRNE
jgi:hypothetical protein